MPYYTVLGYTDNKIIDEYLEKYFSYLKNIISDTEEGDVFYTLDSHKQKEFLLHPDISSLLQDISNFESLKKLSQELKYFCNNEKEKLTMNHGGIIDGTNIRLTLDDNNPQNMQVGHPDHDQDGMIGWGDKSEQEWLEVFGKAFKLLKNIDADFFYELNSIIKKIVPMKTSIDVHNSCSYKECIGTLYLGYTINAEVPELSILEALIHESSHNKLNLIMQSYKLHANDYSLQYYSPYRPDARHIQGVFLGVHAIVPTVHVLLQGIEKGYIQDRTCKEKVMLYHIKNKLGLRVLKRHGRFTKVGKKILDEMSEVITICDGVIKNNTELQKIDFSFVQKQVKDHFLEVRNNYTDLQY